MKPTDVHPGIYIGYCVEHNDKYPKVQLRVRVRISKYKNIFWEGKHTKLARRSFFDQKCNKYCTADIVISDHAISDLNDSEIFETVYEKVLQNTSEKEFRIAKSNQETRW